MIYSVGIIIALFLSFILVSKKDKSKADWILFAWLLTIALNLTLYTLQIGDAIYTYPFLLGWAFPLPLLHWPFLFLYVTSLTTNRPFQLTWLLHLLPCLFSIALFSGYLFLPDAEKLRIYNNQGRGYEVQLTINLLAITLSALVYTILSFIKLWHYRQRIKNEFSYLEKINLNWVFYLIVGMTMIFLTIASGGSDKVIYTVVVGFVVFVGYFGINQVGIFTQRTLLEAPEGAVLNEIETKLADTAVMEQVATSITEIQQEVKEQKYQKSNLSEAAAQKIYDELNKRMQVEKLYKNAELTLDELAAALDVLPNHLSQVINSLEHKNFYDYINQLRVNEFVRLISLPENRQFTLLSLAFECGFNSKTSFNRNFKKATGFTPSEYLKLRPAPATA